MVETTDGRLNKHTARGHVSGSNKDHRGPYTAKNMLGSENIFNIGRFIVFFHFYDVITKQI